MLIENLTSGPAEILIVTGTPAAAASVIDALQNDGHHCRLVHSEPEAFEAVVNPVPDLILLDCTIPGSDGYEICHQLKTAPGTARIPVVFLEPAENRLDVERLFAVGAADYIPSPLRPAEALARVRAHLKIVRLEAALDVLSITDNLTGLANRRQFEKELLAEWNRAARRSDPVAVLLIDVDLFKSYVRLHGQVAGETCLKRVAGALQGALTRATDVVARFGNKEFAVLLPGAGPEEAKRQGDRLCQAVRDLALPHGGEPGREIVTISAGAAALQPSPGSLPADLLGAADQALFRAKERGRDRSELAK
ncbi:MAG: diguanylate cyclase [Acidobacteria bacterium]|nr:diguanylate cyclase [Acidobacteriota bacterium]MCG3191899.1 Response regulator PleD [Thermoanaerobaculia bacterium]